MDIYNVNITRRALYFPKVGEWVTCIRHRTVFYHDHCYISANIYAIKLYRVKSWMTWYENNITCECRWKTMPSGTSLHYIMIEVKLYLSPKRTSHISPLWASYVLSICRILAISYLYRIVLVYMGTKQLEPGNSNQVISRLTNGTF